MVDEKTLLLLGADEIRIADPETPPYDWIEDVEEEEDEEREENKKKALIGTLFSILAGITFTSANVIQKFVPRLNFWDLLFVRGLTQIGLLGGLSLYKKLNPLGPSGLRTKIYAQGVLGGFLLLFIFIAVKNVPLGDVSAIFFSAPFFTMIFSTCTLREPFGLFRLLISLVLILGVILLCRPGAIFPSEKPTLKPTSHFGFIGLVCAWAVPVLSAFVTILTRQCKGVPYIVLALWFGIGAFMISVFGMNIPSLHSSDTYSSNITNFKWLEWIYTFSIVSLGIIGNIVMTIALRYISPAKAMVFRSFEVVLNYILQITLFTSSATPFHATDPLGAIFIMFSVLLMGLETVVHRKWPWKYL